MQGAWTLRVSDRAAGDAGVLESWTLHLTTPPPPTGADGLPGPVTALRAAAPNPFNPRTTIAYRLKEDGAVALDIFDLAGRRVRTLVSERQPAGPGQAVWDGAGDDGRQVAAGVYFARLRAGGVESLHKLSLVK